MCRCVCKLCVIYVQIIVLIVVDNIYLCAINQYNSPIGGTACFIANN